jgi:hypothetical protein
MAINFGNSSTFFNYGVWESAEHFKHAINGPEYRSRVAELLPNTTMSPHSFQESSNSWNLCRIISTHLSKH